jgi:predicted amidohydrolase YtcJ
LTADLLLINGRIKTMNPDQPNAEAVAIRNGRISAVGSNAEARAWAGPLVETIDLAGRTATPGLNDAHSHPMGLGASMMDLYLRKPHVTSITQIVQLVRERAVSLPDGAPVLGRGYDQAQLDEQRHPTRHDLDGVSPNHPVLLLRACHHIAAVNTHLLRLAGIDRNTPDPEGGTIDRDEHGEPTGVLRESAMNLVRAHLPEPSSDDIAKAIKLAHQAFLETGVTSTIEAAVRRMEEVHAYQQLRRSGELKVRSYLVMMIDEMLDHMIGLGIQTGFGDPRLRIGPAKLFSDGSLGGRTARMKQHYEGQPENLGLWMEEPDVMKAKIAKAHNAGFQVAVHAIGDDAVDVILGAYEAAIAAHPRPNPRHRIEHALLVSEDVLVRMKAAGVVPIPGTSFNYFFAPAYAQNVGEERLRYSNAMASFKAHGIIAAASTDAPVVTPNASIGLYSMVTRKDLNGDVVWGEQAISLDDALRAYTWAGAYASFEEDIKGSLEPGKLADIAVFETDLDAMAPDDLKDIRVDLTISEGEVVYERR